MDILDGMITISTRHAVDIDNFMAASINPVSERAHPAIG